MGLINTNGLVLIGPGSEWFWSTANAVQRMDSLPGAWESERIPASWCDCSPG
jgi:hypothetical protein